MKLILTGKPVDARKALAASLVAEVVPTVRTPDRALEIAGRISKESLVTARLAKGAAPSACQATLEHDTEAKQHSTSRH